MTDLPEQAEPTEKLGLSNVQPGPESPSRAIEESLPASVPGDIVELLPETEGNDKPGRRHLVLAPIGETTPGIAVYGSGKDTAQRLGAACNPVLPRQAGAEKNGLAKKTYFYPGRASYVFPQDIVKKRGKVRDIELGQARRAMRAALGITVDSASCGTCQSPKRVAGSWRGRVVEIGGDAFEESGIQFGLVVTEHVYSSKQHYQLLVALVASDPEVNHVEDVVVADTSIVALLGSPEVKEVVFAVPFLFSVMHRTEILADTGVVVPSAVMARVDAALSRHLQLDFAHATPTAKLGVVPPRKGE
jgi:hypothetical protein